MAPTGRGLAPVTAAPASTRGHRARTVARRLVLVLALLFGLLCLGYALLVLRAVGWRAWPLALLLTVLTAAAWTLVLAWWQPTRVSSTSVVVTVASAAPAAAEDEPAAGMWLREPDRDGIVLPSDDSVAPPAVADERSPERGH